MFTASSSEGKYWASCRLSFEVVGGAEASEEVDAAALDAIDGLFFLFNTLTVVATDELLDASFTFTDITD